ncbi:F-box protein SKIP19 [Lolium perenne]|uniref:F-box protein SKIP19 n=1 Tax=Lolium perenne TaxID=4522 RepID=UPI0021E9ED3F|nr:F-box protein SKIP19-like [Lolium perenne]
MSTSDSRRRHHKPPPARRALWVPRDAQPAAVRGLGGAPRQRPAPPNPAAPRPQAVGRAVWVPRAAPPSTVRDLAGAQQQRPAPPNPAVPHRQAAVWVPREAPPATLCDVGLTQRQPLAPANPTPAEPRPHPAVPRDGGAPPQPLAPPNPAAPPPDAGPDGEARDWAALPLDAITCVLRKLDHIEILMGAGQVCHSWRCAARDHPALWRRIDMRGHPELDRQVNLYKMAQGAIRRAQGQCEAFWAEYAADDDVLRLLGDQAPSLKSLSLIACQDIMEFEEEIKKFPLLEELEISLFTNIGGKQVFEEIGKACPELKHLKFNAYRFCNLGDDTDTEDDNNEFRYNRDDDALGIASMHGLRSLQLFGQNFTNKGLTAILDNCPHLESLDIRHCFNISMDGALRRKCRNIKTLKLPNDPMDGYDLCFEGPLWSFGVQSDSDDYAYAPDYILDSDEYDDYCDPFRYLDGVYESELNPEDRMFLKGMRMFMKDSDDDDY